MKLCETIIFYKASAHNAEANNYIGMTGNIFKERSRNHVKSFNDEKYSNETELAKHVWYLKKQGRAGADLGYVKHVRRLR